MAAMSPWAFRLGLLVFFFVVYTVFYAVAYSVLMGIRDNYRRYAQKASLQWTGPPKKRRFKALSLAWLAALAALTAWLTVDVLIFKGW